MDKDNKTVPAESSATATIRAIGPRFDGEVLAATRALYDGHWDLSLPTGGNLHFNLAYGRDARQALDLASLGGANAPILLFVPGGGFVGGDKSEYVHVAPAFARLGFATAVMNYRLAPTHAWPAGAMDVAAAIDWFDEHATEFGANGSAIYVLAQSGGAAHASGALFDPRFRPRAFDRVRSGVLMSGFYRMEPTIVAPNVRAYFGEDPAQYVDRSPVTAVPKSALPVALTVSEFDPKFLALQTLTLAAALAERDGRCPPLIWNEGHNHVSPVLSIGTPGDLSSNLARLLIRLGETSGADA